MIALLHDKCKSVKWQSSAEIVSSARLSLGNGGHTSMLPLNLLFLRISRQGLCDIQHYYRDVFML